MQKGLKKNQEQYHKNNSKNQVGKFGQGDNHKKNREGSRNRGWKVLEGKRKDEEQRLGEKVKKGGQKHGFCQKRENCKL